MIDPMNIKEVLVKPLKGRDPEFDDTDFFQSIDNLGKNCYRCKSDLVSKSSPTGAKATHKV